MIPYMRVDLPKDRTLRHSDPIELIVRQREYRHDTAMFTIEADTKSDKRYSFGQPVTIKWGFAPQDVETFHGYVHHVEQRDKTRKIPHTRVYCIGASYRMNEIRLRSHKNKQAHEIAALIASDHSFSLVTERHDFTHEHLTQHGRSDWDFLTWLAKRHGYTFYVSKTNVVFLKRSIKADTRVASFTFRPARTNVHGSVYSVHHRVGEATGGNHRKRLTIRGVDNYGDPTGGDTDCEPLPNTVGLVAATVPVHTKILHHRPVHSDAEALDILSGWTELQRFHHTATAELSGDTRVHQGSTIKLNGLDSDSNGYWYTGMVDHHVTRKDYRLHVELGRDALGDVSTVSDPPVVSFAGKPMLLDDCEVAIEDQTMLIPDSVLDRVDDCQPIEQEVIDKQICNPLGLRPRPNTKDRGTTRHKRAAGQPKKTHKHKPQVTHVKMGGTTKVVKKPAKPNPKLDGWKAEHHKVIVKGAAHSTAPRKGHKR